MEADCALERGLLFPEVGRDFRCEQEQINVTPRDVLPPARGTEEDDGLGRRGYVQSIKKADLLKPEKEIHPLVKAETLAILIGAIHGIWPAFCMQNQPLPLELREMKSDGRRGKANSRGQVTKRES